MKIAIRADGGSQIGMGHIMRTLVLAKELNKYDDIEVFYICSIEEEYFGGNSQGFDLELASILR
jgi:spore coat polysaccharide biosynthesis predicted glycosyltransferase SpsG